MFGFYVQTAKGNDEEAIDTAIENAKKVENKAVCIVLDTIKGQGIKYFEELESNHSVKFNNEEIIAENHKAINKLKIFIEEGSLCTH